MSQDQQTYARATTASLIGLTCQLLLTLLLGVLGVYAESKAMIAGAFYLMCVGLAYLLVNVWPWAYVQLGFSLGEAVLMSVGVLSIHHFIVDAYIWKLKPGDSNRQVVASTV